MTMVCHFIEKFLSGNFSIAIVVKHSHDFFGVEISTSCRLNLGKLLDLLLDEFGVGVLGVKEHENCI